MEKCWATAKVLEGKVLFKEIAAKENQFQKVRLPHLDGAFLQKVY